MDHPHHNLYNIVKKYTINGHPDHTSDLYRPDGPTPYNFELLLNHQKISNYAYDNWLLAFNVGVIYIVVIFGLKHFMKDRKPFKLKNELFIWNAFLGLFSICGFVRVAPELYYKLSLEDGFYRSICIIEGHSKQYVFWATLFKLSKFIELLDTVFIVLRKKPLRILQWYHHFSTMVTAWAILPFGESINIHYVFLNYGVHSLMYTYFALMALDYKIPRSIATFITSCQLAQMIIALLVSGYSAFLYYSGVPCYRVPFTLKLSFFVTVSFNVLFGQLFYNIVIQKKNKTKTE